MKKLILIIIIIAIIVVISLFVFMMLTQNKEEQSLIGKTEEQIAYLENKVITMMNQLNQIHFSNNIVVEQNIDNSNENTQQKQESSEGSNDSSNSASQQNKEGGSSQGDSSQESKEGESENKQQTSSEDNLQFAVKNNSILTNGDQKIDWDYIKNNTEIIYSTWPSMMVDLHELNVKNEDILNFSNTLDQVTLAVKQEDKSVTLNNLASLYGFLPNYRGQISKNNNEINIDYTKACLLNSYALVEQDKWEEVKSQLENANTYFSNIMNSINGNGQKQSQISKIYVLLNELNKTIDYKDKELFFIKYRNAMEELMEF